MRLPLCFPALLLPSAIQAQSLSIPTAALADSTTRPAAVARLAIEAAAAYRDTSQLTQFDNQFRLQLLAGRPAGARASLAQLRATQVVRGDTAPADRALDAQYEIYLRAKQLESDSGIGFPEAFGRAFRERFARLDDRTAALVARTLSIPAPRAPESPQDTTVALADAVAWLRAVQIANTYGEIGNLAAPLLREEDSRRYILSGLVPLKTSDGATVCVTVWRPRKGPARVPALFQFTIYADTTTLLNDLRRNASNGYAAVLGFTRGKACSPDQPVPSSGRTTTAAT